MRKDVNGSSVPRFVTSVTHHSSLVKFRNVKERPHSSRKLGPNDLKRESLQNGEYERYPCLFCWVFFFFEKLLWLVAFYIVVMNN